MFNYLSGKVERLEPGRIVLNCMNVGYDLAVPLSTYNMLKDVEAARVYTYLQVGENVLKLYGFFTTMERDLFLMLIGIHGVGPSMALRILSGMPAREFGVCVQTRDVKRLRQIKGVGPKLADRLVAELKDKVGLELTVSDGVKAKVCPEAESAVAGMVALGYKQGEAFKAVEKVIERLGIELSAEELVTEALQNG